MTADIAWAAGLFEGEGTITIYRRAGHNDRVGLMVCMTDRDVLDRFAAVVGAGANVHVRKRDNYPAHHKTQFQWGCGTNADTERILHMLLPWLGERRTARAREALDSLAWSRVHCSLGHEKPLDSKGCATCLSVIRPAANAARRAQGAA